MSVRQIRILFRAAALFNLSAVLLFLPAFGFADRLGLHPGPTGTPWENVGLASVGLFGIVQLGRLGKVGAVAIVVGHYLAADINLRMAMVVGGDAIFAGLFAWYLAVTSPRKSGVSLGS